MFNQHLALCFAASGQTQVASDFVLSFVLAVFSLRLMFIDVESANDVDGNGGDVDSSVGVDGDVDSNEGVDVAFRILLTSIPAWNQLAGDARAKAGYLRAHHFGKSIIKYKQTLMNPLSQPYSGAAHPHVCVKHNVHQCHISSIPDNVGCQIIVNILNQIRFLDAQASLAPTLVSSK